MVRRRQPETTQTGQTYLTSDCPIANLSGRPEET